MSADAATLLSQGQREMQRVVDEAQTALIQARALAEAAAQDPDAREVTRWQARVWLGRFAPDSPIGESR